MIRHCVMVRLADETQQAAFDEVMQGLADLVDRLEGCSGFCAGKNRDFENKSPGFGYGFTLDASEDAALAAYAAHPEHKALGARLVALCEGGGDGIMVFDIEVPS